MITKGLTTDAIPQDILEHYYIWLLDTYGRHRHATVNTYLAAVLVYFRFLTRRNLLPATFSYERARVSLKEVVGRHPYTTPRIDRRLPLIVMFVDEISVPTGSTPEEYRRKLILLRDKAIMHTLFTTGLRREELTKLNRKDIAEGTTDQIIITGKGRKERLVFFSKQALAAIREYLCERNDQLAPVFIRHDIPPKRHIKQNDYYRLTPYSVWRIVKHYANMLGIIASPHDFRHTKASTLLNSGASLSEVQDLLGHASPETTKRIYAHYEISRLRTAFEMYSKSPEELSKNLLQEHHP
jgi:site-specific recombinase XerD